MVFSLGDGVDPTFTVDVMLVGDAGGSTEVVRVFFTGFALVATVNDLRYSLNQCTVAGAGGSTEVVSVFLTGLALVATVNDLRQCVRLVCRSRCRRFNRSGQRVLDRFRACSDSERLATLVDGCCRRGLIQCF